MNKLNEQVIEPLITFPNHVMWDALVEYPKEDFEVFHRSISALIKQLVKDGKVTPVKLKQLVVHIWHQVEHHEGTFEIGWMMFQIIHQIKPGLIDLDKINRFFIDNIRSLMNNDKGKRVKKTQQFTETFPSFLYFNLGQMPLSMPSSSSLPSAHR